MPAPEPTPEPVQNESGAGDRGLRATLLVAADEARAAWPDIDLPSDGFAEWFIVRPPSDRERDPSFDPAQLRLNELFLAWACTRGDAAAIAHFERLYFTEVDVAYRRFESLPMALDDARQRTRELVFLKDPPALAGYAGTGDLRGWLRATVLHMLINASTRETRERPTEGAFFDAVVDAQADAEAAYLKQACRAEFEEAFVEAMTRLLPREKLLLRYAFADRMSVDQIGAVYRVHRATAARWVARAREKLVGETRSALRDRLQVGSAEAESIVRAAISGMGSSLIKRFG